MNELPDEPKFTLCAGHPALDFVNTLDNRFHADGPAERLLSYEHLWRFAAQCGLVKRRAADVRPGGRVAEEALRAAIELREAAALAFYRAADADATRGNAPSAAALPVLRTLFRQAADHQELCWVEQERPTMRAEWRFDCAAVDPRLPVWMLARECEGLLTSTAMANVRACSNPTCRWLFLDGSKNHRRRWCDMKLCGNRMKARRFQARRPR